MQDRTRLQGVSEPLNPRAWQSFGEYTAAGQVMLTHLDGYAIVRARKGFTENPRLSARAAHGAAAYILSHVDVLEPRFRRPDSESERVTRHAHATMQAWAIIYNPDTFAEEVCMFLGRNTGHP